MKSLNGRMLKWRNRTTIQRQLSLIVALAVTLAMAGLIMFNYVTQARANMRQQASMLQRVLALESRNLDSYITELRAFSLQLRNNAPFMDLIAQRGPLSYAQRQTVESALKFSFYSRSDIETMELYLVRQDIKYTLNRNSRKMTLSQGESITALPDYDHFIRPPDFSSTSPSEDGFIQLTRTIIDSPQDTPLAVVRFIVNRDMAEAIVSGHGQEAEQLCIFGANGERYDLPSNITDDEVAALQALAAEGQGEQVLRLGGQKTLCIASATGEYGFALIGLKPLSVINASLIATRNGSILLGAILLALTISLVLYWIRLVTKPLSVLAHRLRRVGTGNFTTRTELEGSAELIGLSEDANEMMLGIHRLIERNYVAQLNERTAQLIALEAQMNPHFLFNTLQAISTQAILHGQTEMYEMIAALAALLRYSIRGGNLVSLQTELDHVEKYLSLQRARFGVGLGYELHVDESLRTYAVPKLSILSLVENAITHGLRGESAAIHIRVEAEYGEGEVILRVRDNGCGIAPEKLAELRETLALSSVRITKNIGLANLASRLRLLYNGRMQLGIESRSDPCRETVITISIPLEAMERVPDIAD